MELSDRFLSYLKKGKLAEITTGIHSLSHFATLCTIRFTSRCHLLLFVAIPCHLCHSLSLVVTRCHSCITGLSVYKQSQINTC